MTFLTAIPLSDIKFFLTLNEQSIPLYVNNIYSAAWDLIISGTVTSAPPSVTDWIIAYNLLHQNINIPIYKTSEILLSPDKDLKDLANLLTLPKVDKERIIRILGYLNILNNDIDIFEALPQEILINIIKELDCKSILLICKSSTKFNKFCELELDTLLKQKLHKETKFITSAYNREELIGLCRLYGTKHISIGEYHSLILKDNGQVYAFGSNSNGQLGLGHNIEINILKLIPNLHNIKHISTRYNHSSALNSYGQVYSWGLNNTGQLGFGDKFTRQSPTLVPGLIDIIQISIGYNHSLALNIHNQVYSWGYNGNGQLGLENNINRNIPTLVSKMPKDIIQISAGSFHTLALTKNGKMYTFGSNNYGQLGFGDYVDINIPTLVMEAPNNVIQISTGHNYSLCLTNDGHIYSFGINTLGQLGLGDYNIRNVPTLVLAVPNNIVQISAGGDSSFALSNTGKVYAFGYNEEGQLGLGNYSNINIPTLITNLNNIIQISNGDWHSLVLRADGRIYSFGSNRNGELGMGNFVSPIKIPTLIPNFNVLS